MTADQIAEEAGGKLLSELEEAGYLDFDGGEQEEREQWRRRFILSFQSAIEEYHRQFEIADESPLQQSADTKRLSQRQIYSLANLLVADSTSMQFLQLQDYESKVQRWESIISERIAAMKGEEK